MERDAAASSGKIPVIVAAAVTLVRLISFIPGCLREFLCLLLQQLIQSSQTWFIFYFEDGVSQLHFTRVLQTMFPIAPYLF